MRRSSGLFACFPGGGARYGAHMDGGGNPHVKFTSIVYVNKGWGVESGDGDGGGGGGGGGELELLDESDRCWWSIPPEANTLLIFRCDRTLHRVRAVEGRRWRYALTNFWEAGRDSTSLCQ